MLYEGVRQDYLKAMGVTPLSSKYILTGAAPSFEYTQEQLRPVVDHQDRGIDVSQFIQPNISEDTQQLENAPSVSARPTAEASVVSRVQTLTDLKDLEQQVISNDKNDKQAQSSEPALDQSSLRLSIIFTRLNNGDLLLEAIPHPWVFSTQQEFFYIELLKAFQLNVAVSQRDSFKWPIKNIPDNSAQALSEMLAGKLYHEANQQPYANLILLGAEFKELLQEQQIKEIQKLSPTRIHQVKMSSAQAMRDMKSKKIFWRELQSLIGTHSHDG